MKTILITGHQGFIGSHLWAAFAKLGGVKLIGIDLKTKKDIRYCWLPKADLCFHLAALTDARSADNLEMAATNIRGTVRMLATYRQNVVFTSSSAVNYPCTGYAISKLAAEHYCRLYGARIVRLCNITGPGGHGVFEKFEQDKCLTIAGDGQQIRTFAPVSHAVQALIEAPAKAPGALTILDGEDMTVNAIAARYFPDKPRTFIAREATDVIDGRQL